MPDLRFRERYPTLTKLFGIGGPILILILLIVCVGYCGK